MIKRLMSIILSLGLLWGLQPVNLPPVLAAEASAGTQLFENLDYQWSPTIRVILDGKQLLFDVDPQVINGRTLVPMRTIFESFGLTVDWDSTTMTARGTSADTSIVFTIGSNKALVNNQEKILDVPAIAIDGRTMIPLRFLSENMGYHVVWVDSSNLILLSRSDIIEWRYGGYESIAPYKEYEVKYINGVRTAETRYTGKNHEVKFYTLYNADGRLIPNVPEFNLAQYGAGWSRQSPFAGKTYWVDISMVSDKNGDSLFYVPGNFVAIYAQLFRDSAPTGNYLKVKIEDHYFNLATWKQMGVASNPELSAVQDESSLDGKAIKNSDTIFKVTVNDRYPGLIKLGNLLGSLLEPQPDQIYTVLEKDPRTMFDWPDSIWTRLKGETPWTGMTSDMLLVQLLKKPNIITKTPTRFTVFELWIYEYEYEDSVYFFDNGILAAMWSTKPAVFPGL